MPKAQATHPVRIFAVSALISVGSLLAVWYFLGPKAAFITFVLMLVEITFSFDNAIINARILATMSVFWQKMFITVGILIAVFGMRLVFPILLVMITAGLSASSVLDLALNKPQLYAEQLERAHPLISAFGGMFLLMLCFAFFFDPGRRTLWINIIERPLQRIGKWWIYTGIAFIILAILSFLPGNEHQSDTFIAGTIGILLQLALNKLNDLFSVSESQQKKSSAAMAGLMGFLYLQVLDASFSFDGVLGAFAVTQDVILIAIGLGVGALWVRSLTLYMVQHKVLGAYRYLEHGAHYTIGFLAAVLLAGLFFRVPEVIAGGAGIAIVSLAVFQSIAKNRQSKHGHAH